MSGVTEASLEAWEQGEGELPNFDVCYKIGQAIAARTERRFILQDLWQALKSDKLEANTSSRLSLTE